jgi:hypothetical protein
LKKIKFDGAPKKIILLMKREISSLSILGKVTMIKSKDTKPKVAMSHQKRHQNSKRIATLLRVNLAQNR